jgi:magnesium-transporting ATPase (P-type)
MRRLGVASFVVIVVDGVFAFVQENRAERAAERLRDLLPRRAVGRRLDLLGRGVGDGS